MQLHHHQFRQQRRRSRRQAQASKAVFRSDFREMPPEKQGRFRTPPYPCVSIAVSSKNYMATARSPPPSTPSNSQLLRPIVTPLSAFSAGLSATVCEYKRTIYARRKLQSQMLKSFRQHIFTMRVAATAVAVTAGRVVTRRLPTSRTRACHTGWRKREFRQEGFSTGDTPTACPAVVATWHTS